MPTSQECADMVWADPCTPLSPHSNRVSDYHASGATRNKDKPGSPTVKQAKGMRKEGRIK